MQMGFVLVFYVACESTARGLPQGPLPLPSGAGLLTPGGGLRPHLTTAFVQPTS